MPADKRAMRLGVLAVVAALLFSTLGVRLWFLQTVQAESLQETVDARQTKTVRLVPERGRILDASGRILADNQRVLTVSVDWDVIRRDTDRAQLFSRLSGWLDLPVADMEARYDAKLYSRYKPLPLAENVPSNIVIAIQERIEDFPGVEITEGWKRVYPYAPSASHVIGYLGAITAEDEQTYQDLGYDTSVDGETVGRAGVELSMESVLHGKWGEVTYEVDANNRIVREVSYEAPVTGQDIQLAIDLPLQQYAERLLQTQLRLKRLFTATNYEVAKPDGTRGPINPGLAVGTQVHYPAPAGSIVAMNNQTGAIMAMASYPTFDNRWFSADVPDEKFAEIFPTKDSDGSPLDPDKAALTNRAIQGQYNVGSTFKPFTAYAALATGRLSGATTYNDEGTYKLSNASIKEDRCAAGVRCVFRNSTCPPDNTPCRYGTVNVESALAVSSDSFFYHLGEEFFLTPGTQLQDQLSLFGFGVKTAIDLPFESGGRVPTSELKKQLLDAGVLAEGESANMQPGDVLLLAIGQGLLAATPLQLTVGYSVFGNGGTVVVPHVVQAILAPETPNSDTPGVADMTQAVVVAQIAPPGRAIAMPESVLDPINRGLRRNITGPGTAAHSTTAEELFADYPADAIQVAGKTGTAQGRNSYPWYDSSAFSAYSIQPDRGPYTVTAYLEKAGYGSTGAAPVVKCMFMALSGLTPIDGVQLSEPLDTTSTVAAAPLPGVSTDCMSSKNANTITPGVAVGAKD